MCECGCSTGNTIFELPGPGKTIYLLEFGHGCRDCETPAGVIISKIQRNSPDYLPELYSGPVPFEKREFGEHEKPVGFADGTKITKLCTDMISQGFGVSEDFEWPENFQFDPDELKEKIYEYLREELSNYLKG